MENYYAGEVSGQTQNVEVLKPFPFAPRVGIVLLCRTIATDIVIRALSLHYLVPLLEQQFVRKVSQITLQLHLGLLAFQRGMLLLDDPGHLASNKDF